MWNELSRPGQGIFGTVSIDALGKGPRWPVESFDSDCPYRHRPGIYAWYADARVLELLRQAGLRVRSDGLAYVGMTSRSFKERVLDEHFKSLSSPSNLHRTLTWVIAAVSPKQIGGGIKELMDAHFKVAVAPIRAGQAIDPTERRLIAEAEPCLNLKGLDNENTKRIKQLGRKRTDLGWFRLEFWAHVSRRHPDEAPAGWAGANVYHSVEGRRLSPYVAQDGAGVFFPKNRGESPRARAAAVKSSVEWLRKEMQDPGLPDNGWLFMKTNSGDIRNWDSMADWLHNHRLLYERALRETANASR